MASYSVNERNVFKKKGGGGGDCTHKVRHETIPAKAKLRLEQESDGMDSSDNHNI